MADRARPRRPPEAIENYAKAIYALEQRGGGPGHDQRAGRAARRDAGSASAMVKKLDELGLVTHVPYRGVRLTDSGRQVALEVLRHHRLLELYLAESLGVPWDRVHDEAEVLEHVLSEELEELIAAKLGNPTHDPHGDPIPSRELVVEEQETSSLASLRAGERAASSCACRTPTPRCCATSPSAASRRASGSRSSSAMPFDGPLLARIAGERARARRPAGARDAGRGRGLRASRCRAPTPPSTSRLTPQT